MNSPTHAWPCDPSALPSALPSMDCPQICGAAIILSYNNSEDTLACIQSVLDSQPAPAHIIIIDNASTDDSLQILRARLRNVLQSPDQFAEYAAETIRLSTRIVQRLTEASRVLRSLEALGPSQGPGELGSPSQVWLMTASRNAGYAAGNNLGLLCAQALDVDLMWILNNDTLVHPHAYARLKARCADSSLGLCGALLCYLDPPDTTQCLAGGYTNPWTVLSTLEGAGLPLEQACTIAAEQVEARINFIYGASVMVRRAFLDAAGLMDERFFMYCEEQDWAYRAQALGFRLGYAPALVWHKEGVSTGWSKRRFALRPLWMLTRARILLTAKHKPFALPTVLVSIVYAAIRLVFKKVMRLSENSTAFQK